MSLNKKPMRYAHPEGHTDVCYFSGEKGGLITCGSDGDVRFWLNLTDDDPATSCVSEQSTTVISKNGKIYVGNDNNTVQILSYPDLEKEGIVTRFGATISALTTTKKSKLIASGACDMKIHVTNIDTLETTELSGHDAPILGLSLDPKEEFLASSSADGTIRVWNIKEKRSVHTWNNVVPKCNSFLTAKIYCVPSFNCKNGDFLAYPHGKDVVVVERSTWKETFRLKCPDLKTEISICKFSECGTRLAASSFYGEIVVWDLENKAVLGHIEHQQNAKITSFCWHPEKPKEIVFCDALGQMGCIEVLSAEMEHSDSLDPADSIINGNDYNNGLEFGVDIDDDDEDDENVISLNKIKSSVNLDPDQKSVTDILTERVAEETKKLLPVINLQEPFQPSSTPEHLLSRYMVWNDVGIVMCFTVDDGEESSSIEVQFHDSSVHHSIRISNYLHHTMAALSTEALAMCCTSNDETPSKLVVVVLQGWGSGNKEWSVDLPEGEEAQCVAVGTTFVAVATDRRNLRIFMIGGTQREIIAIPGPVVAMNGFNNHLLVTYHTGIGASDDQHMSMLWIRIIGQNLRSEKLEVPLSPKSKLMWLGLSNLHSPTIMDSDGVIKMYNKKSSMWMVACDTDRQPKGKMDNFFIIGISETERIIRCILCKGSFYPPTNPRPIVQEIPIIIPLCEPDTEKSEKEAKVWQIGSLPEEENEAVLMLIALACRSKVEFRAVELCQQIASPKVIDLAIKYAARNGKMALANKLESIGENKIQEQEKQELEKEEADKANEINEIEEEPILPALVKKPEIEIRPLTYSQGLKKNPFIKTKKPQQVSSLLALDMREETKKLPITSPVMQKQTKKPTIKTKEKLPTKKESYVKWYVRNKQKLEEEFPGMTATELTAKCLEKYRNLPDDADSPSSASPLLLSLSKDDNEETRKRKLSETDDTPPIESESKKSALSKLAAFIRNDEN
ncbi:WD repeat and HMG-box DNA-binding protein 1 [Leptopilina heterotoma]|uniref:WD repeat and HMG-box DNA-binding protein 1 n=1 Tax=Leptopilina heterotoma TaxID=63436 RepID=UPI001CAA3D9E|nr:WD repeat and HMG-box DNA-binding protein 1 [Leptopilina heterotoma]